LWGSKSLEELCEPTRKTFFYAGGARFPRNGEKPGKRGKGRKESIRKKENHGKAALKIKDAQGKGKPREHASRRCEKLSHQQNNPDGKKVLLNVHIHEPDSEGRKGGAFCRARGEVWSRWNKE